MTKLETKLLLALESIVGYDTYRTEYDGRMYEICHSCGDQDGNHSDSCEYVQAKALIAEAKAIRFAAAGWVQWGGGKCPVAKGVRVDVLHRNGDESVSKPAGHKVFRNWGHTNNPLDIVAYRLAGDQQQSSNEPAMSR